MIDEKQIEKLCEILVDRIEKANLIFLQEIGKNIKKIGSISPSEAHKLINILKYGTSYNDIIYKISQLTNLNIKDINKIFEEFAKKDQLFFKKFYEYRNVPFIPYENNYALQSQVSALKNIAIRDMDRFTRANVLGYSIRELPTKAFPKGRQVFLGLRETYNRVLDEALLSVSQGKESFDTSMRRILKEIGGSGLKTLDYQNGRSIRLDSAVRMHLQDSLRNLHNEMQETFGKEFDSDGVEISVHLNPAPDHLMQGRQFSNEEFEKLQNGDDAKDYKGVVYNLDHNSKNGFRPISTMNCYHYIFSIVLGVSQPQYSDEQLKDIINENNTPIEIDGKKYTKYECTQLQRKFETAIRKQKDIQILARASGNDNLVLESQQNITQLTNKYNQISKKAGLPTKNQRLAVSGYKRVAIKNKK